MATITVTSPDISVGTLIPPVHKGSPCGQGNINPAFNWVLTGFVSGHISDYEIYMVDLTASGNGPGGKFIHWGVTGLANSYVALAQMQMWSTENVLPSDYGSGDASNGYNGPCAPSATDNNYQMMIVANILPEAVGFVGAAQVIGTLRFTDNINNVDNVGTGDCGQAACPPGSELIDGLCQTIETSEATLNGTFYTVEAGATSAENYGRLGMRIYDNIDGLPLPLRGNNSALLVDDDGVGTPVPLNAASPVLGPVWYNQNLATNGRLNIAGIWALGGTAPIGEWIGFSTCVVVPTTGVYCLGLAADNRMRCKINGTLIAVFETPGLVEHFRYWHVIPITLNAGANIIELEGYNESSIAAFGAEIYDATPAELIAVPDVATLESQYLLWSTKDRIGQEFNIGETSGYTCPDGTSYDSCNDGQCVKITYTAPKEVECCQLIENCKDPEETYLIKMDPGEPDIYQNYVYVFAGDADLLANKCFKLIGLEVCDKADIEDVTIVTVHGDNNCLACESSQRFESCDMEGTFIYVAFAQDYVLIESNVYELSSAEGCWRYKGVADEIAPEFTDVTITVDHSTNFCLICVPCHIFTSCADETEIRVRFAEGVEVPTLNGVYELGIDEALLGTCWKYTGTDTCDEGDADYIDVSVTRDYDCDDCDVCNPKYLITDCSDSSNTDIIEWDQNEEPLDETLTYVFDFEPDICYNIQARPPVACGINEVTAPAVPVPETPGWANRACVLGFMDTLRFVATDSDEGQSFIQSIDSLIINDVQYIVPGNEPEWDLPIEQANGLEDLTTVPANNDFGLTYLEQVNGMNAAFVSLGLEDIIKVQVVTNDYWAGTAIENNYNQQGGYYLILNSNVTTMQIALNDGYGYVREYTRNILGQWTVNNFGANQSSNQLMYEFITCTHGELDEPFLVNDRGNVIEPEW